MWLVAGGIVLVVGGGAVIGLLGHVWNTRCGDPPPSANVLTKDPVFSIGLQNAVPGEIHGISGTGDECGALGTPESTAFRVWSTALPTSQPGLLEAAAAIEALGVRLNTLVCRSNGSISFGGSKTVDSGDFATVELTGRETTNGSEISIRLYLRPHDNADPEPQQDDADEDTAVDGECAPELVDVLG